MNCPNGSEPRPNSPAVSWISARDLLSCNGQPGEPWYCRLLPDIPNLLSLVVTADFCSQPQPEDVEYPTLSDTILNTTPANLIQKARHKAWNGLCRCKLPPPPPNQPNLLVPERPDCSCNVDFGYYRFIDRTGQVVEIGGGIGRIITGSHYVYSQTSSDSRTRTFGTTRQFLQKEVLLYYNNRSPEDVTRKENYSFGTRYTQQDISSGNMSLVFRSDEPYLITANTCTCPPLPESPPPREPPAGMPPPPDICCPQKPPDLSEVYRKIAELEELIRQLKSGPILGIQSIESPGNPYGIKIRQQSQGG